MFFILLITQQHHETAEASNVEDRDTQYGYGYGGGASAGFVAVSGPRGGGVAVGGVRRWLAPKDSIAEAATEDASAEVSASTETRGNADECFVTAK